MKFSYLVPVCVQYWETLEWQNISIQKQYLSSFHGECSSRRNKSFYYRTKNYPKKKKKSFSSIFRCCGKTTKEEKAFALFVIFKVFFIYKDDGKNHIVIQFSYNFIIINYSPFFFAPALCFGFCFRLILFARSPI